MTDKLLELMTTSARVGFAVMFAGICILLGRHFQLWTIPADKEVYIVYGMLFGTGLLIAGLSTNAWNAISEYRSMKEYRLHLQFRLLSRKPTPSQSIDALFWIAWHEGSEIKAYLNESCFQELLECGCLTVRERIKSSGRAAAVFQVDPRVYKAKNFLAKYLEKGPRRGLRSGPAPWPPVELQP